MNHGVHSIDVGGETLETRSPFVDERLAEDAYAYEGFVELAESPFVAGEAEADLAGELHELLENLYDAEFDEALLELSEAAAEAAGASPLVHGELAGEDAERYVREWLEPLHLEGQMMLEAIERSLEGHDLARMPEAVLEELLDENEPLATGANPEFEEFLGGVFKKVKRVVSGAAKLAKKGLSLLPINTILARLKPLVRPLLERVLQMALNRLPPNVRPAAEMLKRRLLGAVGEQELEDDTDEVPTTAEVSEVQQEFDVNTASLLFAADEAERDAVVAEAFEATTQGEDPINDLTAARRRFEEELRSLPQDADPQPAVEQFVPAVMAVVPLLRTGISLVGRDRVVRFIARYVAQLIRPYVADKAPALSQAIASTGLGLLSLEAPVDPQEVSSSVLSGTVEDTVRRLGEEPAEALEHPELLGAAIAHAFDEAAAANFPPRLIKVGRRPVQARGPAQPDHGRPARTVGMWVTLPGGYRRYTKVLTVRVTPAVARQVRIFGGTTLESFLRDRYGISGEIMARVHLYEARAGDTLGRIAVNEKRTPGLGRAKAAWKLQPLTPEAAGLLLGEPGLGKAVNPAFLVRRSKIAVGQRFYHLELERAKSAGRKRGRSSMLTVREDPATKTIRVALFLSEARAQKAAGLIRTGGPAAANRLLLDRLRTIRIEQPARTTALRMPALPNRKSVRARVGAAIVDWLTHNSARFVAGTERPEDGVTLIVELRHEPGGGAPASVRVVPGLQRA